MSFEKYVRKEKVLKNFNGKFQFPNKHTTGDSVTLEKNWK